MIDPISFPSLIPDFDYGGYYQNELEPWLKVNNLWEQWCQAAMGSTVGIRGDKIIVYKVDIDCFLAGKSLPD